MNIKEKTAQKVKKLFETEPLIEFPNFLTGLRLAYGRTRRNVCRDMDFSEMRMFCLENGLFRREIPDGEFSLIAEYYGIEPSLLKKKAEKFMAEGKNKPQGHYVPRKLSQ